MTDEGGGAPLWARVLACALVALMTMATLAIIAALAVRALRLLAWGLVWLVSMAWGGGVAP